MNISKYSKCLSYMYTDKFSVKRYIEVEEEDGSTEVKKQDIEELKNIPCRLSKVKNDEHNLRAEDVNSGIVKLKVFCNNDIDIRKGDIVTVKRIIAGNIVETIIGIASKPMIYDLSQEFLLIETEVA